MNMVSEDEWAGSFPVIVNQLLNPGSHLAKTYPHLHNNLRCRLEGAFDARGDQPISRCTHTVFDGYEGGRGDALPFQENEDINLLNRIDPTLTTSETIAKHLCTNLANRMELYGLAGTGSKSNTPICLLFNSTH